MDTREYFKHISEKTLHILKYKLLYIFTACIFNQLYRLLTKTRLNEHLTGNAMLNHLSIHNFAIAKSLDLSFHKGFSAMTGETGAGKSVTLDALNLVMGARADSNMLGIHDDRAEVSADFDISQHKVAQAWLKEQALESGDECIVRRIINKDGRSRAFINGRPTALKQVQELAQHLISIHGQHAQQQLLERSHQRQLLDRFGKLQPLADEVSNLAKEHSNIQKQINDLQQGSHNLDSQRELLQYQLEELTSVDLQENELEQLEAEQKRLTQADEILFDAQNALDACQNDSDSYDALQALSVAIQALTKHPNETILKESYLLLSQAKINIEEACLNLQNFSNGFQADPERLHEVETRLQTIYELARKHRVQAHELLEHQATLEAELAKCCASEDQEKELLKKLAATAALFHETAGKLAKKRQQAAKKLCKSINQQLTLLNMPNAQFSVSFESIEGVNLIGTKSPQFLIATNQHSKAGTLKQIASGGELSRISLAIEIATQDTAQVPTLIFDEVDTGIGGATAEVVGQLMRQLGSDKQVLCITHQAQLAAKSHHHYQVSKVANKKHNCIETSIKALDDTQRVEEISRMIGGVSITEKTREHAQELLKQSA